MTLLVINLESIARAIEPRNADRVSGQVEQRVVGAEFAVRKSQKQKQLEAQGCVFRGQELLNNHEIDPMKECYCGRPRRILDKPL